MPSLPGLGLRQLHRVFFALRPDRQARDAIGQLVAKEFRSPGLPGAWLLPDDYHISLLGVAEFEDVPEKLEAWGSAVARSMRTPPFELCADGMMRFAGSNALVLLFGASDSPLRQLQQRLVRSMHQNGVDIKVRKPWLPHLTIGYNSEVVERKPIDPIGWTAREFLLIDSPQAGHEPGVPRHRIVGRWPFA